MTTTSAQRLGPEDELFVPKPRRLMHSLAEEDGGDPVLYVYYGVKEICFDQPRLLPFGRGLLENHRFRAGDACAWSDGEPHGWNEVRELLEILVDEGVLSRASDGDGAAAEPEDEEPAAEAATRDGEETRPWGGRPPTWSRHEDRCPYLTAELFGRSQGLDHLEFLVPSFRVAHPAFDRDGRQVGEANVFPPELKADVPTDWRPCNFPGSRFQDERPMNVSALKAMSRHWGETLGHVADARAFFLERTGAPADEDLGLADLYLLSLFLLAIPGYTMVRPEEPIPSGELSAALASMFRVVDGVRFSAEHMIHGHGGVPLDLGETVSADDFLEYVERNCLFLGVHGVCSGPTARVLELLELMIAGRAPAAAEGEGEGEGGRLAAEVGSLEAAFFYGLLGNWLTAEADLFWIWTARRIRALAEALRALPVAPECPRPHLADALEEAAEVHDTFQVEPRLRRPELLRELVARWRELAGRAAPAAALRESFADNPPGTLESDRPGDGEPRALRAFLEERGVDATLPAGALDVLAPALLEAAALERRLLRVANPLQEALNRLLARGPMSRPLDGRDLVAHGHVTAAGVGSRGGARPTLTSLSERLLGVETEVAPDGTAFRHGEARLALGEPAPSGVVAERGA